MNKKALLIIVAVVIAGAGILVFQSSRKQGQFTDKIAQAQTSMAVHGSAAATVDISGFSFKQQIIKIKKGTKVTWTNKDNAPHTVTSDEGNLLDSAVMNKNGTYEKVFDSTGTFRYHCTPHPDMLAAVIVVD